MSPRRLFRVVAIAEAVTWVLLISGMIVRSLGVTALGVSIGGALHGFVFLAFVGVVIFVAGNQRWRPLTIALGLLSAVVPLASIVFDVVAESRGLLDGGWRTDDSTVAGRLRGFVIGNPVVSALVALAAVAAVFVLALVVGPPGG